MKRIFKCPIEAVYMAKHYGVRFVNKNGRIAEPSANAWGGEICGDFWVSYEPDRDKLFIDEAYVHPDDEHIFVPKEGDIDSAGYALFVYSERFKFWLRLLKSEKHESQPAIRNGKAFFCGEIEG